LSVDLNLVLERLAKCFVLRISSHMSCTPCFKYCTSGIELDWSTSTRDLGITIDNNLKFDQHISTRCSAIVERPRCRVRYSFRQK